MDVTLLKIVSRQKPREIAAQILQRREAGQDFVENLLENALARSQLSPADRGLCQEIVYGVVRWQAPLDWLIARKTTGRTQKAMLQNLLRLGLYQIFWLDRIPNHAAVNETVELARHTGFGAQSGFVNAILRNYLREFDATRQLLADLKKTQPHLGYSHPEWLVARWQQRWGVEKAAQLMEWNNTPPKTFARVNTLKTDAEKLLPQWRDENVEYDFVRRGWLEENLVFELKSHPPLMQLPSFQHGLFYVQDPGTLPAVRELNPQPGETVLDLCAAPGGKTTYIAQLMQNEGRIVAQDVSSERLKLVEENCNRLGVACVEISRSRREETQTSKSEIEMRLLTSSPTNKDFDKILVDAPCSNTGVMRRRVDLRWRIRPDEIVRLQKAQLDLLLQSAPLLKSGGILVYSTCSLEPEENGAVVREFLSRDKNFELECEHELLPFADAVDGAFVAKISKREGERPREH
jgi:16S rRNA (cytosine967-C5)-methyltransferase